VNMTAALPGGFLARSNGSAGGDEFLRLLKLKYAEAGLVLYLARCEWIRRGYVAALPDDAWHKRAAARPSFALVNPYYVTRLPMIGDHVAIGQPGGRYLVVRITAV